MKVERKPFSPKALANLRAAAARARAVRMSKRQAAQPPIKIDPQTNPVTVGSPQVHSVTFTVNAIPFNPRMVSARDGTGKTCAVFVGNNETFTFGDKIQVVPHRTEKQVWTLVSPVPRDRRRP